MVTTLYCCSQEGSYVGGILARSPTHYLTYHVPCRLSSFIRIVEAYNSNVVFIYLGLGTQEGLSSISHSL